MIFYEKDHIYREGERQFTSVTALLHLFEPVKNWKAIAKRYATKVGKSVAEVETEWKQEKDSSVIRGKDYHSLRQSSLNRVGVVQRKGVICDVKFFKSSLHETQGSMIVQPDFRLQNNTLYTEFMIWDDDSGICGMADEVEVVNQTINVNDHKTSKEVKKEGFYVRNVGRQKLVGPVSHLDDCNWSIYCLQLSVYMYMLWRRNKHLKVGKLTLNHVQFDRDGKVTEVVPHDVPYLRTEVKAILDWWKLRNK